MLLRIGVFFSTRLGTSSIEITVHPALKAICNKESGKTALRTGGWIEESVRSVRSYIAFCRATGSEELLYERC